MDGAAGDLVEGSYGADQEWDRAGHRSSDCARAFGPPEMALGGRPLAALIAWTDGAIHDCHARHPVWCAIAWAAVVTIVVSAGIGAVMQFGGWWR